MIKLKRDLTITKLYIWAEILYHRFHGYWIDEDHMREDELQTNRCYFIRRVFIYTPLILLMQLAAVFAPVYALVIYPMHRIGHGWWHLLMWITVIAILALGVMLLWKFLIRREVKREMEMFQHNYSLDAPLKPPSEFTQTVEFIWDYLKEKKKSLCPIILIEKKEQKDA